MRQKKLKRNTELVNVFEPQRSSVNIHKILRNDTHFTCILPSLVVDIDSDNLRPLDMILWLRTNLVNRSKVLGLIMH